MHWHKMSTQVEVGAGVGWGGQKRQKEGLIMTVIVEMLKCNEQRERWEEL